MYPVPNDKTLETMGNCVDALCAVNDIHTVDVKCECSQNIALHFGWKTNYRLHPVSEFASNH